MEIEIMNERKTPLCYFFNVVLGSKTVLRYYFFNNHCYQEIEKFNQLSKENSIVQLAKEYSIVHYKN